MSILHVVKWMGLRVTFDGRKRMSKGELTFGLLPIGLRNILC